MTPDSLSSLVQDGSFAFRVTFAEGQALPSVNQRYWRGPVLTEYDGKTWRRGQTEATTKSPLQVKADSQIRYQIVHNGATKKWLVPLDMPNAAPAGTTINSRYEVQSKSEISKPTVFSVVSYSDYQTPSLTDKQRQINTALPEDISPQTRQLAANLRLNSRDDKAFVEALLQHFRGNDFYYDLAPPAGNADMDTFLFDNRVGYCQHYASAFVFMARAQNLPARVVTGYQGGEINSVSKELEVRQLHAHAWAEVYFPDQGWVRADPTQAVSPERVNRGTPFGSARHTDSIAAGARWQNDSDLLRKLGESLRAMDAFWQNWVLNYSSDKQRSLWQRLGIGGYAAVAWLLLFIAFIPVTVVAWLLYRRYQNARFGDDTYRALRPFLLYIARYDMPVQPAQPLSDWLASHRHALGASYPEAAQVIKNYYQLRYRGQGDKGDNSQAVKALTLAIKRFKRAYRRGGSAK